MSEEALREGPAIRGPRVLGPEVREARARHPRLRRVNPADLEGRGHVR